MWKKDKNFEKKDRIYRNILFFLIFINGWKNSWVKILRDIIRNWLKYHSWSITWNTRPFLNWTNMGSYWIMYKLSYLSFKRVVKSTHHNGCTTCFKAWLNLKMYYWKVGVKWTYHWLYPRMIRHSEKVALTLEFRPWAIMIIL